MPRAVPVIVFFLAIALSACQRAATPLPHEAYVWQREWTPALLEALHESRPTFAGYRVLAAETDRGGRLTAAAPDLRALAAARSPVTAVLRLNGSDPVPGSRELAVRALDIVRAWRAAGVSLAGIEIDHDCATARLPAYARLLAALRAELPRDLRLSITALPAWMDNAALRDVLASVDESALQVHAVRDPATGLFDPGVAQRWINAYARISSKAFRVALPAYGVRAEFDRQERALAVSAEMPRDDLGAQARELAAAPADVARLLRGLERERPAHLAGVLWFRLPTDQDRRAWSLATLRAVIEGVALKPAFAARMQSADGATDLVLTNRGEIDAPMPAIDVQASACDAADGANGFVAQRASGGWRFVAPAGEILRAGRARRIGWVHCGNVEKVDIDGERP